MDMDTTTKTTIKASAAVVLIAVITLVSLSWPQANAGQDYGFLSPAATEHKRHQVVEAPVVVTGQEAEIPEELKAELKQITK